jgi:OOP family OmpA-OmpF porin
MAAMKDNSGFKDPALFTRMPGYFLPHSSSFKEVQFDAYDFMVKKGSKVEKQRIEGHWTQYYYYFDTAGGKVAPSALQVQRNYMNAVLKVGGKVLYEEGGGYYKTTLFVAKNGQEMWAEFQTSDGKVAGRYQITIVERQTMAQDVVASAEVFSNDIKATGHAAVYGIYFDTGKSVIKPESDAAIGEIAKLLKGDLGLKVHVVGHTDNVGGIDSNMKLSQARADAVLKALASKHGIDAKRLKAFGVGQLAPVASNKMEEGRAKNRRVELVEQ